jgi:hypothetical protein
VLTNAGAAEQSQGWRAIRQDVFARRWQEWLTPLPSEDEACRDLALAVVSGTDEASAADVAGVLGWRRKQSESVLTDLGDFGRVQTREEDGVRLWSSQLERR